ncbi:hypothetical protein PGAG_00284 [Phaeocystis globosa virus 12T]|uniref:Uncharacterized protein n=1 Tax=Phaeocystis globosa virus PgV-16T TaxID=3071227 RepID=A0AC59EXJ1_9VIRU|nr:hypothetical protein PGCG_00323 [Phaeocystis globosa virus]AET73173.1 hypothetical protein PGAG_00284 [Phaeocystis globosa virus 12T]AET73997.1 hypothetical protein PGBG_00289 [Phaeocystis globosa virus 14T]AGM15634.1 hypothetical protein PGCG_00323 [Phaeocystis globosa virus PgV-16T]UYE94364.1 hypothetical protein PGV14T_00323 [Phaeocystis globosa virus]
MDYITGEKNKAFLWNMLYENKIFKGIPNNKLNDVKSLFENVILNVSKNSRNDNILEINKEILSNLNSQINGLKKTFLETKNIKDEFKEEKSVSFDKNLETHRNSLDELIKPHKPEDIDFADKTDKPIDNTEMNRIIEEMQKERDMALNVENPNPDMGKIPSGEVPKLKIEPLQRQFEREIVDAGNISLPEIPQNIAADLEPIHKILNNILENQEKIMKKLKI